MTEKKKGLTVSVNKRFRNSISKLYPELSNSEVKPLADGVLNRLSHYIEEGYSPAVTKPKPDGSMEVVVLYFEKVKDELKKKTRRK